MTRLIWDRLRRSTDRIVDRQFGEPVELHPWGTGEGYTSVGAADTTRKIVKTLGIYVTRGAAVVGESGDGGGAGASDIPLLEADIWLSIQQELIGPLANWKKDDRVFFPARNEWYSIIYIPPSATVRPNIHLVRLQAKDLASH